MTNDELIDAIQRASAVTGLPVVVDLPEAYKPRAIVGVQHQPTSTFNATEHVRLVVEPPKPREPYIPTLLDKLVSLDINLAMLTVTPGGLNSLTFEETKAILALVARLDQLAAIERDE